MSRDFSAPQTAAEAADQLRLLTKDLHEKREEAKRMSKLAVRFAHIHRRERALATLYDEVRDLSSADLRKAAVELHQLKPEVKAEVGKLAGKMGLAGIVPDTVGDLQWLRERCETLASSAVSEAFDAKDERESWRTPSSMAKAEMELAATGDGT